MRKFLLGLTCFVVGFFLACSVNNTFTAPASESLKGKILLQVEDNGEAWYVHPESGERYFMGRPLDAFNFLDILSLNVNTLKKNQSLSTTTGSSLTGQ